MGGRPGALACEALLIQHATHMRHIVTSFLTPYGSTIFFDIMNGTIFNKKVLNIKCVFFIFSTTFV
jgi:hypothetical protein